MKTKSERIYTRPSTREQGTGPDSAGQAGDLQGISGAESASSESVEELLEEGQTFEAEAVAGVEDAPDADEGGIRLKQVPVDDVPDEYLHKDQE